MTINLGFLAAGGNRHPSAADWAPGLLAFGSGNNIALWNPDDVSFHGIIALLAGHTDTVNAVKLIDISDTRFIISGSADKSVRIWFRSATATSFKCYQCLTEHQGSVNTISVLPSHDMFATAAADGALKIWVISGVTAQLVQSISLNPHYLPLTSALTCLDDDTVILAVAGTSIVIDLYVHAKESTAFSKQATLTGHEGWIRSLDFTKETRNNHSDILLSSASQDKYIRLWRFCRTSKTNSNGVIKSADPSLTALNKSLSNRTQQVGSIGSEYNATFEALLVGHEDWIYTARWIPREDSQSKLQLLSASADNSMAIWRQDHLSGVWICHTRLGEISAQKGSTTATGSAGGFWIGLPQPAGESVVSLAGTGSWRKWTYDASNDQWTQDLGISGHTQELRSLAWSPDGSYILTTSADQTTRLFALWNGIHGQSWHEFARPQIHGYDLTCIDTLGKHQFITGADEKLLRVFSMPKNIAGLLKQLSGMSVGTNNDLPDAANIPVLGLSNKAVTAAEQAVEVYGNSEHELNGGRSVTSAPGVPHSTLELRHPPFEDHLSRHTLWPEYEKLYGHGYEISAVAASHDGSLVATACKASSLEHAVIRLYECQEWREIKPALTAHNLTVTALAFSPDDRFLLSVGRDRQWAMFARDTENPNTFKLLAANPKGHSRMILDCCWAPVTECCIFATAGRDRSVKIWRKTDVDIVECVATITKDVSITAVAFEDATSGGKCRLALGTEKGEIQLVDFFPVDSRIENKFEVLSPLCPSSAITRLRWRPKDGQTALDISQLAVASEDTSLRLLYVTD